MLLFDEHGPLRATITMAELYPSEFIRQVTPYDSLAQMVASGGFRLDDVRDFPAFLESEAWNAHVARFTLFASWREMEHYAVYMWLLGRLERLGGLPEVSPEEVERCWLN